ncbi:MAG: 1-deoxy-D-xylulose-5-phosphate synthase [Acidobacteriota bacterium]
MKSEPLLDKIHYPSDIRKLPVESLPQVCKEVRQFLIESCSRTGGHFASGLGVVELTVALHYVFNTPLDKILWDVGHQAYPHKIITGRKERFHTIRQYEGLGGFCRREESEYDVFNAGHAGTSISAGLGMVIARDLAGANFKVISVIGDGGLTAGMAMEGLNQVGYLKKDMLIVLNDNEMSISPNVGAMKGYLHRIVSGQVYQRFKEQVEHVMTSIPGIGSKMFHATKLTVDALKTFLVPGMLFEELGFQYIGPMNGHEVISLVKTLQEIRDRKGPVLLHVVTKKGKGYDAAEKDAVAWHGPSPFDVQTATMIKKTEPAPSYTSVFAKTLMRLAEKDKRVVAITAAMLEGTGLDKFAKAFPDRCFDVGIAEQHAVTMAAGMALEGLRPVVAIYSTFLQRAYDQVVHDVCLMDIPVVFCMDRAGLVGNDGPTHHGVFDIAYMRCLPNMVVMAPKDENELQHMLRTALYHPHPVALRIPRGTGEGAALDEEIRELEIGRGETLRQGSDIALIAYGSRVYPALAAAERLAREGVQASVINARFAKPIDAELIVSAARTHAIIVTVEDHVGQGGFGAAVCETLQQHQVNGVPALRLAVPDQVITHGAPAILYARCGLDADGIYNRVRAFWQERPWQAGSQETILGLKIVKKNPLS